MLRNVAYSLLICASLVLSPAWADGNAVGWGKLTWGESVADVQKDMPGGTLVGHTYHVNNVSIVNYHPSP